MKYEKQKIAKAETRARIIAAALNVWEAGGIGAVTARAVGERCNPPITGQRVQAVFKTMAALRDAAAAAAVASGRAGVILQMQAARHPRAAS